MLFACLMYLISEPIGFNLGLTTIAYIIGGSLTGLITVVFMKLNVIRLSIKK